MFDIPDRGDRAAVRNWNTIVQILSLRTQPTITRFPSFRHDRLNKYRFGSVYSGDAKIWSFKFTVEHPEVLSDGNDPIGNLISDSNLVPMVDRNNVITPPTCLMTSGDACNIYFVYNN